MKIFYGKNRRGIWRASLNEETISRYSNGCYSEDNIHVLHNAKVYMVEVYCGFDYTGSGIRNVIQHSGIFHSIMAAKKGSKSAKKKLNRLKKSNTSHRRKQVNYGRNMKIKQNHNQNYTSLTEYL